MTLKRILLIIGLILSLVLTSCEQDPKKIDKLKVKPISQIQKEEGIPVRIKALTLQNLEVWQDYTATLNGYNEVQVSGLISEVITDLKVSVGDKVKKDQLIAVYANDNAQSQYKQAKINVETLEKTYKRMKSVFETGGIAQQDLDQIEAQYKVARENFKAARELIYITAPISGIITEVYVTKDQKLSKGKAICKITDNSKLKAVINVNEKDILKVSEDSKVKITWEAIKGREFEAKVNKIALSANPKTRSFDVEIVVDNSENILKPGTFVEVFLRTINEEDILVVDRISIIKDSAKEFVFVTDGQKAYKKVITTGMETGDKVEVTAGVMVNNKLVIEGQTLLKDGDKIKIVE